MSAGLKFRKAVEENHPLQLMGTITAYTARMAEKNWSQSYLSIGWWCCR